MQREVYDLSTASWRLWRDVEAPWRDDAIHLPGQFDLAALPRNPPTIGWAALWGNPPETSCDVTLPSSVEEHFWGADGLLPVGPQEYFFNAVAPVPECGIYRGVSWWWCRFELPEQAVGKRVRLAIPAARLRAEVFLNETLVGYDIIGETPFECDVTDAVIAGVNRLAIRITNPGGRLDWMDFVGQTGPDIPFPASIPLTWGERTVPYSHGFGGLDSGIALSWSGDAAIVDIFVRNHPEIADITFDLALENHRDAAFTATLALSVHAAGDPSHVLWHREIAGITLPPGTTRFPIPASIREATPWSPQNPALYELTVTLRTADCEDRATQSFGFRWFTATGIGNETRLRLNGRRIRLRSAISWNYWALNGLFPTDALLEAEIHAARQLGLNMINCHRNLGNVRGFAASDAAGLMRWEECGAGREAWSDDPFRRDYMREKLRRMVMRDRNSPSLMGYTLQNEQVSHPPDHPPLWSAMELVRELDPTRPVILQSGFQGDIDDIPPPMRIYANGQSFFLPGDNAYYRDSGSAWCGWFDHHTVGGPGIYQDWMYDRPDAYTHGSDRVDEVVFWGEVLGAGSLDNLADIKAYYEANPRAGGYHKSVHLAIIAGIEAYLARWEYQSAFADAGGVSRAVANRAYYFWGRIVENMRISDAVDGFAISGWESTDIEQHCGLVDVFRNLKGDPALIARYTAPVVLSLKVRGLVHATMASPVLDVHLIDEVGVEGAATLRITLIDPDGTPVRQCERSVNIPPGERAALLLAGDIDLGVLDRHGHYRLNATLDWEGQRIEATEEIFVVAPRADLAGIIAVLETTDHLAALVGRHADLATASDWRAAAVLIVGEDADGPVARADEVIPWVAAGGIAVILADGSAAATRWAEMLGAAGAAVYSGMVGPAYASWTGSWYLARSHPLLDGLPADCCLSWEYQTDPRGTGAWFTPPTFGRFADAPKLDAVGMESVIAYGRDHNPEMGTALAVLPYGRGRLFYCSIAGLYGSLAGTAAGMAAPTARRLVENILAAALTSARPGVVAQ